MENKASIGVFQKHENNKLAYVLLAFTQGKRWINRTFSDIRKRTVHTGFTWYSPFCKLKVNDGFLAVNEHSSSLMHKRINAVMYVGN